MPPLAPGFLSDADVEKQVGLHKDGFLKWADTMRSVNSFILAAAFIGISLSTSAGTSTTVFHHSVMWGAIAFALSVLGLSILSATDRILCDLVNNLFEAQKWAQAHRAAVLALAAPDGGGPPVVAIGVPPVIGLALPRVQLVSNLRMRYERQSSFVNATVQAAVIITALSLTSLCGSLACLLIAKLDDDSALGWIGTAFIILAGAATLPVFLMPHYFFATNPELTALRGQAGAPYAEIPL